MPRGSSSIFFELKESILLYDLSGVGSRLDRELDGYTSYQSLTRLKVEMKKHLQCHQSHPQMPFCE
jgi:hypothetical protein